LARGIFCGRQWLFHEIEDWLDNNSDERALLIKGDPRTGKSAVVAELVFQNPGGRALAYHCCQADTQATLDPARMIRSLAAMIAAKVPAYAAQLETPDVRDVLSARSSQLDPASALELGLLSPLGQVSPPPSSRYLLIDALDESL